MRIFRIVFAAFGIIILFLTLISSSYSAGDESNAIAAKIQPSIVGILTYDAEGKAIYEGSGFFTGDGSVITTLSTIQGASKAEIKTAEDKKYPVKGITAEDKSFDLVMLSADIPQDLSHPLSLTDSVPKVEDKIVVVGSAFIPDSILSSGTIFSLNDGPGFENIMKTAISISPALSGSPVANLKGDVIGIATYGPSEEKDNGFIIPSKIVMDMKPGKLIPFDQWAKGSSDEPVLTSNKLFADGIRLMWAKEYEKALSAFENSVKKSPSAEGYIRIGCCNIELEHFEKSIEANKQAIDLDPNSYKAYNNMGVDYYTLEKYDEAIKAYKQAIQINPDFPQAYYNLGTMYVKQKKHKEAIEIYKELIRLEPKDYLPHYCIGWAYSKLGKEEEAIEEYKKSIELKPDDAKVRTNLGVSYENLGRYEEATKELKEAIRLKPDDALAHFNLGYVYADIKKYEEAIAEFKEVARLKPYDVETHSNLGWTYGELGQHEESVKEYEEALHLDPKNFDVYNNLGGEYENLKKYKEAIKAYKKSISLKSDDASPYFGLGSAYVKMGNYKKAIEAYKDALRLEPDHANGHWSLGYCYLKAGDTDSASKELKILEGLDKELAEKLSNMMKEEPN